MAQPEPKYVIPTEDAEYLNRAFTYHAPKGDQADRYTHLRSQALSLAEQVMAMCPRCPERTLALRKIEEGIFYANAAIARYE